MDAGRIIRVAVAQHCADLPGPDARFAWLAAQARRLRPEGIDLLICAELFMSGYNIGDDLPRYAEPANGAFASRVAELARETGMAILYGYPELDGDALFNSAICIGPAGEPLANHRKLVLPPGFEPTFFQAGEGPTLFDLDGARIAILICYDAEFPEAVRYVAAQGAELVVVPTALGSQWGNVAYQVMPTRSFENGVFLVYANHSGRERDVEYLGASCIVAPDGHDLARAGGGEEILVSDLRCAAVKTAQTRLPYLRDRLSLNAKLA